MSEKEVLLKIEGLDKCCEYLELINGIDNEIEEGEKIVII